MNELTKILEFEGTQVEVLKLNEKALFNPYHIGLCLGISESNVRNYISQMNDKQTMIIKNSDVRNMDFRKLNNRGEKFLYKSGVYRLIFKSRKPNAEIFQDWVTDEVLPQIEITGGYIPVKENEPNEIFLARAVKVADETIKHKDEIISLQAKRLEELKPIEENYKLLMETSGTFSMNKVAHFVGVGEYRLFEFLREVGILFFDDNNDNVPYEKISNKSKFIVVPAIAPDGSAHSVTRVLPSGIDYICNLLKKHGLVEVA